ncbi:MAG: fatty acid desaturase CarF family protein [bacterium]|nr:fatty acid desaturase CarF family protein [bacterium]
MDVLNMALKFGGVILLSDFLTGCAHFWMDQYGRENMPVIGKFVVEVNILHHKNPRHLCKNNYIQLTWTSYVFGALLLIFEYLILGGIGWGGLLLVVYGSQANLIHKWTHQTKKENGQLITWLQDYHIIQSIPHHRFHHAAPFDAHFCILTDWLNPVLEKTKFWQGVIAFFQLFGIQPVAGQAVRKNV